MGKDDDTDSYLTQIETGLELRELMHRYEEALHSKNKAQAHALAAQLLARPDLPANYRDYLQQRKD